LHLIRGNQQVFQFYPGGSLSASLNIDGQAAGRTNQQGAKSSSNFNKAKIQTSS